MTPRRAESPPRPPRVQSWQGPSHGRGSGRHEGQGLCRHTHVVQGPGAVSEAPSWEGRPVQQKRSRATQRSARGTQKTRCRGSRDAAWGGGRAGGGTEMAEGGGRVGRRPGGRRDGDGGERRPHTRVSSRLSRTPPRLQETRVEQPTHAATAPGPGPGAPALCAVPLPCLAASGTTPGPGSSRATRHPLRVAHSPCHPRLCSPRPFVAAFWNCHSATDPLT